ncbi:hypothetical protein JW960_15410, partial [candidate division KSB1 bacterium]|nr:hypothetical protein [candidate division KSB1 bacterium]
DVNAVSFYLLMSTSAHHRFKPTLFVGLNLFIRTARQCETAYRWLSFSIIILKSRTFTIINKANNEAENFNNNDYGFIYSL